jgi:hypothetical protein
MFQYTEHETVDFSMITLSSQILLFSMQTVEPKNFRFFEIKLKNKFNLLP